MVVDALDLGVEVQAMCLGVLTAVATAVAAVADRRAAGPSSTAGNSCQNRAPCTSPMCRHRA